MTDLQITRLERQARCFVHPILIGSEADRAVHAIVAWELVQQTMTPAQRERAWARSPSWRLSSSRGSTGVGASPMRNSRAVTVVSAVLLVSGSVLLGAGAASAGDVAARVCDLTAKRIVCPYGDLHGRDLRGVNLRGAVLHHADLRRAILRKVDLRGAVLHHANLRGADMRGANLGPRSTDASSRFTWADGTASPSPSATVSASVSLSPSVAGVPCNIGPGGPYPPDCVPSTALTQVYACLPDCQGVDLANGNLQGALLGGANLDYASFVFADLEGADLTGAQLQGTNFASANVSDANFVESNWDLADFAGANTTGTLWVE